MKSFLTLLVREWREWRTVFIVLAAVYALGLVGATIGVRKFSNQVLFPEGEVTFNWNNEEWRFSDRDIESVEQWLLPGESIDMAKSRLLLFGWSHLLRIGVTAINLVLMIVALFYLADAIYNERSDGSTFFYRSLPVGDLSVLASKLLVGTGGFLVASFFLGVVWVLFARVTFPGSVVELMTGAGLSLSQIATLDLVGDWATFHFLQLTWLLPFAAYFLFISTVIRSRPLLVAVGAPLLLGILWLWIMRDDGLLALFTSNLSAVASVLQSEWIMPEGPPPVVYPGESIELFGSFSGYILSLRTLVSLLVTGGFFSLTFFAYRRNLPVS